VFISIPTNSFAQSNILVDEEGLPRICDYGLAFILEPSEFSSIKTAGACRWAAPEIMDPPEDVKSANDSIALFTKESDIYAFSMTALEVNMNFVLSWPRRTDQYQRV
jgi:serine/threonine protein kinase